MRVRESEPLGLYPKIHLEKCLSSSKPIFLQKILLFFLEPESQYFSEKNCKRDHGVQVKEREVEEKIIKTYIGSPLKTIIKVFKGMKVTEHPITDQGDQGSIS